MRPFLEAAKPLYPLIGLFFISTIWAYLSPNNILEHDPRIFFMITGTIFSNFSVRIDFKLKYLLVFNLIFILEPLNCCTNERYYLRCLEFPVNDLFNSNFNLCHPLWTVWTSFTILCRWKIHSCIAVITFQCFTFSLWLRCRHWNVPAFWYKMLHGVFEFYTFITAWSDYHYNIFILSPFSCSD